jgi:hypothetical protein
MKINHVQVMGICLFYKLSFAQLLPPGGMWGCPTIPTISAWDTNCFKKTSEIRLGQGFFNHYGISDPVHFVIPHNRPSYALSIALGWNYFRNVIGTDALNINFWSAIMIQENGFATYNGVQLPSQVFDVEDNTLKNIGCLYPRGCNNNSCSGGGYCWHVSQNKNDGPYHNTLDGYITAAPYFPQRYKTPASTYHPFYNSNMPMATMAMTFYNMSIYRRAQLMNAIDLGTLESSSPDPYGLEAALAVAYNLGPNSPQSISSPGYTLPAGILGNNFWAGSYFSGGVSNYAQRVATFTAILNNDESYKTRCTGGQCPNVSDWDFYSFYDNQISWDTVSLFIDQLLLMYPEINKTTFKIQVKNVFDQVDADKNGKISFRYEMGSVIDKITLLLPKEDPGFSVTYAINGTGCKLGCRAPYARIKTLGNTEFCAGQSIILKADVDGITPSTTFRWFKNGNLLTGRNTDTLNVTTAGQYSLVICWQSFNTQTNNLVTCCAKPECDVTINVLTNCNSCISMNLSSISNQCTGQNDGSILVSFSSTQSGPFTISWKGTVSGVTGSMIVSNSGNYTLTNLRDDKYSVSIVRNSNPACKSSKDIILTPITLINERISARKIVNTCGTNLFADVLAQQPKICRVKVSYGALQYNWDKAFSMDLRVNGASKLYMFEGYNTNNTTDARWDWWPYSWPNSNAPNIRFVDLNDGDIIEVAGTVTVPLGVGFSDIFDGGVRIGSTSNPKVSFTNLSTSTVDTFALFRYKPPVPSSIGIRMMNGRYRVNCPISTPPSYTFLWTPPLGLNNPNLQNPTSSHNIEPGILYTVTATHPINNNCKLKDTIFVPKNCTVLSSEMVLLEGILLNNYEVQLHWQNIDKASDVDSYILEFSTDGQNFLPLQVYNLQDIHKQKLFNYTHKLKNNFNNYYRLKIIYTNKNIAFSNTLVFKNEYFNIAKIFPNPFQKELTIQVFENKKYYVQIHNLEGKMVENIEFHGNVINVGNLLKDGIYLLKICSEEECMNYKIIKKSH